jgi:hypothetical protein
MRKKAKKPTPIETRIRSAVREVWMKSEERKDALIRSRKPCKDGSRKKWVETCEICGKAAYIGQKEFKTKKDGSPSKLTRKVLIVHHVNEVPNVWADDFMRRLFCPADELKILCNSCHDKAHNKNQK